MIKKTISITLLIIVTLVFLTVGASFSWSFMNMNPNIGERTVDILWNQENKYDEAFNIAYKEAQYPWAQLRLGIMYELGVGRPVDTDKALEWYNRAIFEMSDGRWEDGLFFSFGDLGYFNKNSDALIAQHRKASIFLERGNNLKEAYFLERHVIEYSGGKDIYYCCSNISSRYIPNEEINNTFELINKKISEHGLTVSDEDFIAWKLEHFKELYK